MTCNNHLARLHGLDERKCKMHINHALREKMGKTLFGMTMMFAYALLFTVAALLGPYRVRWDVTTGPNEINPLVGIGFFLSLAAIVAYVDVIMFLRRQYVISKTINGLYKYLDGIINQEQTFTLSSEGGVRVYRAPYGFEIEFLDLKYTEGLQVDARWMLLEDRVLYGAGELKAYTELPYKRHTTAQTLTRQLRQAAPDSSRVTPASA